ncbi:hypothetical protein HAX54_017010 [Datura stramonium]|uniref:Uncharacterized protein n=1 Tax=Datura stramonium TaxID=4076 RepID=A0ABS8S296_DATST|nr:hypothetical protein [Datura stramonium]
MGRKILQRGFYSSCETSHCTSSGYSGRSYIGVQTNQRGWNRGSLPESRVRVPSQQETLRVNARSDSGMGENFYRNGGLWHPIHTWKNKGLNIVGSELLIFLYMNGRKTIFGHEGEGTLALACICVWLL